MDDFEWVILSRVILYLHQKKYYVYLMHFRKYEILNYVMSRNSNF